MPNTSGDARQQHPSRRAVLKVGANAAWAVPAIQIAAATPAFAAASGTNPTSKLTVAVLSHIRKPDGSGSVTVQVTAANANAKNVVVTVSGYRNGVGQSTSSAPTTVLVGSPVTITIPLNYSGNSTRTLTVVVTGTDSATNVAATGQTITYSATINTATLNIANVVTSTTGGTANLSFKIASDLDATNVAWTVTSGSTVLKSGTAPNVAGGGNQSVATSFPKPAGAHPTVTIHATATTSGGAAAVPASRDATY